jgi:hypothetical protein
VSTTKRTESGSWSSHGHEAESTRLVERYRGWIEEMGCSYDVVHEVVKEHMRIKRMDEMRPAKKLELLASPHYDLIDKFSEFDNMQTL